MTHNIQADNETLGNKHKKLNKLVQDAFANEKSLDEKAFAEDKKDLNNLMKIDIACHRKDINYIISVLKSEDMLYVSRAIKQSLWLVDDQYADIINPEYLSDNLYPYMTAKAIIKLQKHIRHYLKTENRVEQFYQNETTRKSAAKWLSRCSVPFIEANIGKHMQHITNLEFKRLCEKSVKIFEAGMKDNLDTDKFQAASFLLKTHADEYFNVLDNFHRYSRPKFGAAATDIIMKQIPNRIINNFLKYINYIHVPTFAKYIKRKEVKKFIFEIANKDDNDLDERDFRSLFNFEVISIFIKRIPTEEQFDFVKKVFIDNDKILETEVEPLARGTEMFAIKQICQFVRPGTPTYHWYEFAPFDTAFKEVKRLMQSEANESKKYSMINFLLKCTKSNNKDLLTVLMFYFKNNQNDDKQLKKQFINNLLSHSEIYKSDNETWNAFICIINNINIYTEDCYDQKYIENVILYHILQNKPVPEKILQHLTIYSLQNYRNKLNQDGQNKVFYYMYNHVAKKVEGINIQTEKEFNETAALLQQLLDLLFDWDKQLVDYPFTLNKIKELAQIRKNNSWKLSLSPLYNRKKSWKRLMFEESLIMNPSEDVCINALKHDPGLLVRYKCDVNALCCEDTISLKQLLSKLRIYWPESLADSWEKSYFSRLDKIGGHKALTRGLCTLLPQESLLDVLKKYAPSEPKIDWNNTNELTLGLQRSFAKNMHIARPPPPADTILLYAKGDFLQYALPSLLAIYYNMGRVQSEEHIPKLLDAPVSLQKHGLRFAFIKLKHEELKRHLTNVWQASKNITIRAVSFVLLFDLLCKEKDDAKAQELWEILEVFMDNLSFKEDSKIYEKLFLVEEVPNKIKPKFLVKSYKFLKNLQPHRKTDEVNYEYYINDLAVYTREVMEDICPKFVADIITEYLNDNFFNSKVEYFNEEMIRVLSAYLLCAKDEETQTNKYQKILVPLIKRALAQWNDTKKDKYFIRHNFQKLLTRLAYDLNEYVITNKMLIPTKMFTNIQQELNTLPIPQNYTMITMWKLIVKKTEIIDKMEKLDDWPQISSALIPEYGKYCLDVLKEDVKSYFSCIYVLYAKVLNMTVKQLLPESVYLQIYEIILSDNGFIPAYLVILRNLSQGRYYTQNSECTKEDDIRKIIREHPSVEVKMHYHCTFTDDDDNVILGI